MIGAKSVTDDVSILTSGTMDQSDCSDGTTPQWLRWLFHHHMFKMLEYRI